MAHERIWQGEDFPRTRILVLGESWYGEYEGDLVTDAGWIQAYLDGRVQDRMYSKIANSCAMSRDTYWHGVAYTNFVQRVGAAPSDRPTTQQYIAAEPRLGRLLTDLAPRGVWILGEEQAHYSKPVVEAMGIVCEVAKHPTRIGVSNATLGESWHRLQRKLRTVQQTRTPPDPSALVGERHLNSVMAQVKSKTGSNMKLDVSNLPEPLVAKKYRFPKRAPVYEITINGKRCQAANTVGGSPLRSYTYFIWDGVSYYVPGHISPLATATIEATNVVVIDPALTKAFPNGEAVNNALRGLLTLAISATRLTPGPKQAARKRSVI